MENTIVFSNKEERIQTSSHYMWPRDCQDKSAVCHKVLRNTARLSKVQTPERSSRLSRCLSNAPELISILKPGIETSFGRRKRDVAEDHISKAANEEERSDEHRKVQA